MQWIKIDRRAVLCLHEEARERLQSPVQTGVNEFEIPVGQETLDALDKNRRRHESYSDVIVRLYREGAGVETAA